MCYAIPGKVESIDNELVTVNYFGTKKQAYRGEFSLNIGDFVYAQAGFVVEKVPLQEAKENLALWEDFFFKLQQRSAQLAEYNLRRLKNKKIQNILETVLQGRELKEEEILYLLLHADQEVKLEVQRLANKIREEYFGNSCCVHAIIEISNYCQQECKYCGISRLNNSLPRYRMSGQAIFNTVKRAVEKYNFRAFVLQSGEDNNFSQEELISCLKKINQELPVVIFISFGEINIEYLQALYNAGVKGILLRFETADKDLYSQLKPQRKLSQRIHLLKEAKKIGFAVITGGLLGLPGQEYEDWVNSMRLAKELNPIMYSFGPFIPHPNTPLANTKKLNSIDMLFFLSLLRLYDFSRANILVTTATETLNSSCRKQALLGGANSLMLNATPNNWRSHYSIYPNRRWQNLSLGGQINKTKQLLYKLGRAPLDPGVGWNN